MNGTLITLMGEPNVNYDSKSSEGENEGERNATVSAVKEEFTGNLSKAR